MSRDRQRLLDYLVHILEAIARIERYVDDLDEVGFLTDELTQDAVIRNLEIIGEASNNIDKYYPEFSAQHDHVPFASAYEMRNALAHGYFRVDLEVVWKTLEKDLPELGLSVDKLIRQLMDENSGL
ncbi:DUF86 domain-containing protein [Methylomonas methanica]|uniref:DUF86 domain-containing protein n=1 Tax=Methylomonas methanica TaxID=421 RepID=A0A177MCY6_METMH|nr:DUF86 domain-containing protein [Methylomonas methanica]OAI03608.1 hypothetical protein A1332_15525 [Methylomonas methanica]